MADEDGPNLTMMKPASPSDGPKKPPPMVIPDYSNGQQQIQHQPQKQRSWLAYAIPLLFLFVGMPLAIAGFSWMWNMNGEKGGWYVETGPVRPGYDPSKSPTMVKIEGFLNEGKLKEAEAEILALEKRKPDHVMLPYFTRRLKELKEQQSSE